MACAASQLPDLGSSLRQPIHKRLSSSINLSESSIESLRHLGDDALPRYARAAFALLLLRYLDAPTFALCDATFGVLRVTEDARLFPFTADRTTDQSWSVFVESLARQRGEAKPENRCLTLEEGAIISPISAIFVADADLSSNYYTKSGIICGTSNSDGVATLEIIVDRCLMSPSVADTFVSQLAFLISHASSNPQSSITTLPTFPEQLLSASESQYDPTEAHNPLEWLFHLASTTPDAIAHEIYDDMESSPTLITYGELNERSNRVARWLADRVEKEDRVAVCGPRNAEFYAAMAGVLKSGACYVSIDPELPPERKLFIVQDSSARYVIATSATAFTSPVSVPVISLSNSPLCSELSGYPTTDFCRAELDSLAYLLYTSGTTGTPKGCLVGFRGVYWAIEAMCEFPKDVTARGINVWRWLVHLSEIIQAWRLGLVLVSGPRMELLANLRQHITDIGITHLGMVPSMIESLLGTPDGLPLKYLVSGGEKITDLLLEKWASRSSPVLANFYGPTEATIGCTSRRINPTDRKENIGRPFPSCSAYVVSPTNLQIQPLGVPGELVVEGPLIGKGYLGLPEATAKSFVEFPSPGRRAYRTGDLVRMTPEGTIEIMGRIDSQIKLRGVRIEAEGISEVIRGGAEGEDLEVSTLISGHPAIGSEVLVSFVSQRDASITFAQRRAGAPGLLEDEQALVGKLKAASMELASYMRPAHILVVTFIPLSLNGKTDLKVLGQMFRDTEMSTLLRCQGNATVTAGNNRKALNVVEKDVVKALLDIVPDLDEGVLTPGTELFACGLDSLRFAGLSQRLSHQFDVRLSITTVMASSTIADLAITITKTKSSSASSNPESAESFSKVFGKKHWAEACAIFEPDEIEEVLPPFPVQEGVLYQASQNLELYVENFVYRLGEGCDTARLEMAWRQVMAREQILRTAFVGEGELLQVVLKPSDQLAKRCIRQHPTPITDLEAWHQSASALAFAREINEDPATPMFRVNLYPCGDSRAMVVSLNHAIYDGIAAPQLISLVLACYKSSSTLPSTIPLATVIDAVHVGSDSAAEYWKSRFQGFTRPAEKPLESKVYCLSRTSRSISRSLEALRSQCSRLQVTPLAYFNAAFAQAFASTVALNSEIVFGSVRSGRTLPVADIDRAICPLVTVVPVRLPNLPASKFGKLLRIAQDDIMRSHEYEHVSWGDIQRWAGIQALTDTLFSCRYTSVDQSRPEWLSLVSSKSGSSEFPLAIEVILDTAADTIVVKTGFDKGHVLSSKVDALLDKFSGILDGDLISDENMESSSLSLADSGYASSSSAASVDHQGDTEFSEPEQRFLEPIAEFLEVDHAMMGPETSFISIGLTSLRAVRLSQKLKSAGLTVSPSDILQADNIRGLASLLEEESSAPAMDLAFGHLVEGLKAEIDLEKLSLGPEDLMTIVPASALQAGMLSQTITSGGKLYAHAFHFRLIEHCDDELLANAWAKAVEANDILRSTFHFASSSGRWAQVVHSHSPTKLEFMEYSGPPSSAASHFVKRLSLTEESDFARPPLRLFRYNSGEERFFVAVLHHSLYDGLSIQRLLRQVESLCQDDHELRLSSSLVANKSIVSRETEGLEFWRGRLHGSESYRFPRASSRPDSLPGWRASRKIEVQLDTLSRLCRRWQVSVQCLGQLALAQVLAKTTSANDIVFGQVISGRMLDDLEAVMAPTFNTIPVRIALSQELTNVQTLRAIHRENVAAISWHQTSLRAIQKALGVSSLCDVLFLHQPALEQSDKGTSIWEPVGRGNSETASSQYALNVELHETPAGLQVFASCSGDAMDQQTLLGTVASFASFFEEIVASPNKVAVVERTENAQTGILDPDSTLPELDPVSSVDMDNLNDSQSRLVDIVAKFAQIGRGSLASSTTLASLGVDSISLLQIALLARKQGLKLTAAAIVKCSTISDLLLAIMASTPASSPSASVAIKNGPAQFSTVRASLPTEVRASLEAVYPMPPGMTTIVNLWARNEGMRFRHHFVYRANRTLPAPAYRRAWEDLVAQHPILRSGVQPGSNTGDALLCLFRADLKPRWAEVTLSNDGSDVDGISLHISSESNHTLFASETHRLAGLTIFHGRNGTYLVFDLHHVLYDALSIRMLMAEFSASCTGQRRPDTVALEPFLAAAQATDKTRSVQNTYWSTDEWKKTALEVRHFPGGTRDLSTPLQPIVVKRPDVLGNLNGLQAVAKANGVALHHVLLAAWARVQARRTGSTHICLILWQSGRNLDLPDVDTLPLPCLSFAPLFVRDAGSEDVSLVDLALSVGKILSERPAEVGRSDLRDVSRWVGKEGEAVGNVWVNIVPAKASNGKADTETRVLEPIETPGRPRRGSALRNVELDVYTRPEVTDDLQIDIFYRPSSNSIGMAVECDASFLHLHQAEELIEEWGETVKSEFAVFPEVAAHLEAASEADDSEGGLYGKVTMRQVVCVAAAAAVGAVAGGIVGAWRRGRGKK